MQPDVGRYGKVHAKVHDLNARLRHHAAIDVLRAAIAEVPDLALVSSFGADSVALLHLAAITEPDLPVLFIDTEMLFAETLVYQQEVAERLGLRQVHILLAQDIHQHDPDGTLHERAPDACCTLRKTAPLAAALAHHGGWISGRKRFQSSSRASLDFFEVDDHRIKVNPLAHWTQGDLTSYIEENRLPKHPLISRGYPSIGCAPCTTPVQPGENPRAGRWRNSRKEECGIHFANGRLVRTGDFR
jgi:phosphoadenosine phosphosulfate reductase